MFDDFETTEVDAGETTIFVRRSGTGSPLLLLHGFPQTHLMWRSVAPRLAREFMVVCADLRGYGRSGCPPSTPDHAPYAKRTMARDMVIVMKRFGFARFSVAGHDRGGRVAYRLALDHPGHVDGLAVLDIVPTGTAWDRADARFALGYWPWALLAQPEPLPERIFVAAHEAIVDAALGGWGSPAAVFPGEVRAAYVDPFATLPTCMRSARSIEPPQLSIASMTWRIMRLAGALPARCWHSGALTAQLIPGMRTRVDHSRYGGRGPTMFGDTPWMAVTFSRKRPPNKRQQR
jgi:pimeloyl-ACP methyl ester carboxylesterase